VKKRLTLGLSRKHIFEAVEASLKRLNMDYVDLLQIHRYDYDTPREETMKALHGMIRPFLFGDFNFRFGGYGESEIYRCFINVCISIPWTTICCREEWLDEIHQYAELL
jgi:predicted aldo/keto reductase-like oxidoreductase